jgi:hypothetical protein
MFNGRKTSSWEMFPANAGFDFKLNPRGKVLIIPNTGAGSVTLVHKARDVCFPEASRSRDAQKTRPLEPATWSDRDRASPGPRENMQNPALGTVRKGHLRLRPCITSNTADSRSEGRRVYWSPKLEAVRIIPARETPTLDPESGSPPPPPAAALPLSGAAIVGATIKHPPASVEASTFRGRIAALQESARAALPPAPASDTSETPKAPPRDEAYNRLLFHRYRPRPQAFRQDKQALLVRAV